MPQNHHAGHVMHVIHARKLGQSPRFWRPGTVRRVDGQTASIKYLLEAGSVEIWHHEPLDMLSVGTPVRVHERYSALEVAGQWLNVRATGGLGGRRPRPIPDQGDKEKHAVVVTDLSSGRAIAPTPWPPE